ncbi:LuxR C-terminal-related transcriptional regulator [Paracoccus siganidrum]|uniref:HTH luxR-type domain-containing protein n=1 Tax=Paracoccus siganidrum TaxID=1276757 RepID=A0A418ZUQ3_9RHOB|nr:hypothetical protein D3P05_21565 [Paracoccus siganidrum]RMC25549.1 hypothetical protein C9E82_23060 [Paracoccus siganidrum]
MDDFYAARSSTKPPLPWTNFAPPFSRQAEALAGLAPRRTNIEVAVQLGTTEAAVKKRLQEAYRKIGATDRQEALIWATKNL